MRLVMRVQGLLDWIQLVQPVRKSVRQGPCHKELLKSFSRASQEAGNGKLARKLTETSKLVDQTNALH